MLRRKCFVIPKPNRQAAMRLFCFPYAGGNANAFFSWTNKLPDNIELVVFQMPGRVERSSEPLHQEMASVISELYEALPLLSDKPFCFFGHSLGSKVVIELSAHLQVLGGRMPSHIFVSGSLAPHLKNHSKMLYNLPKQEFINELSELNGTPKEILENVEFMSYLEPMLRADFKLAETYQYKRRIIINSDVTILGGINDIDIPKCKQNRWSELFKGNAEHFMFNGGHFFIDEAQEDVLACVNRVLNKMTMDKLNCLTRETISA
jgi:surfactin synthase thioesterase subunit